ncbi:MAG: glycoside hydrolase family 13 protein [Firmicutes bacterium]|nr:glycoside hydrolase family 13 protein [Bacillota bacterium]MCL2256061.1 glycoside hydrolase family 13 protein [Bacillota bacterium]
MSENSAVFRIRVDKRDKFESIKLVYGSKYWFFEEQKRKELSKKFTDKYFDYYETTINFEDFTKDENRIIYIFELSFEGKNYYFSEEGVTEKYDFGKAFFSAYQLPPPNIIDIHKKVDFMDGAVFYQIFVDRFSKGNEKKDSKYINLKTGDIPTWKCFAGGDLKGIISKLKYLNELGVTVIYLTPIFRSNTNHKYDTIDFFEIDPHFGSVEDVKTLVDSAHKIGIQVVFDAVFNHCAEELKQWRDVVEKGKESQYFDWFTIAGDFPTQEPKNYKSFGNHAYMPRFNTSNKEVQAFLLKIATYWIKECDIDGWRLDVADEVSKDFWRQFRRSVKELKPNAIIIGENWHDASSYLKGDIFDSIMNYGFTRASIEYFVENNLSSKEYSETLSKLLMKNTNQANEMLVNLIDSHDMSRFLTRAGENVDKLILALSVLFLYKGVPMMYYGTEIGMIGGHDPDCRRVFDWSKAEETTPLMNVVKSLSKMRKSDVIKSGDIKLASDGELFVLERFNENSSIRLSLNNSKNNIKFKAKGKILLENNFKNNILKSYSFVIEQF